MYYHVLYENTFYYLLNSTSSLTRNSDTFACTLLRTVPHMRSISTRAFFEATWKCARIFRGILQVCVNFSLHTLWAMYSKGQWH